MAAEVHAADRGDTATLPDTLEAAEANLAAVGAAPTAHDAAELVAGKGYHSRDGLRGLEDGAWRSRIAEKKVAGVSRWRGDDEARRAVYNNRARPRSGVAREAFKRRAELCERGFALVLGRGGMRRAGPGCAAGRACRSATSCTSPATTSGCSCGSWSWSGPAPRGSTWPERRASC